MRKLTGWVAGAFVALAGCGGGGGGGGPPGSSALAGEFALLEFDARFSSPAVESITTWGRATAGGSVLTSLVDRDDNGVPVGPEAELPFLLRDDPGARIRLLDSITGDDLFQGGVLQASSLVLAGSVRVGDAPAMLALIRQWSVEATDADLTGGYRFVGFRYDGEATSSTGTMTFNGDGTASVAAGGVFNTNGTVSSATLASPTRYAIGPEGAMGFAPVFGGLGYRGALHPSSDLFAVFGSTSTGAPSLFLGTRSATTATLATFSGDYAIVGIRFAVGAGSIRSLTGRLVADGLGNGTIDGTRNDEGVITTEPTTAVTYTVAADGRLVMTTPSGTWSGAVSPGGEFAVLGGGIVDGDDPVVYLLAR